MERMIEEENTEKKERIEMLGKIQYVWFLCIFRFL